MNEVKKYDVSSYTDGTYRIDTNIQGMNNAQDWKDAGNEFESFDHVSLDEAKKILKGNVCVMLNYCPEIEKINA